MYACSPARRAVFDRLLGIRCRRLAVVIRQLRDHRVEVVPIPGLDGLRDLAVGPDPSGRRQLLEQRGAHQRVAEAVPVQPDLVHQSGLLRRVEHVDRGVLVDAGHVREHRQRELLADHRGDGKQLLGVVVEPRDPATDDLAHAFGKSDLLQAEVARPSPVAQDQGSAFDEVTDDLADEEGVSPGLGVDGMGEGHTGLVEVVPGRALEQLGDTVGGEPVERSRVTVPSRRRSASVVASGWERSRSVER